MQGLCEAIPDAEVLLGLAPEELGMRMLGVALDGHEHRFWASGQFEYLFEGRGGCYPGRYRAQVQYAIAEAWNWLLSAGLFIQDPTQGGNAYVTTSRRGQSLVDDAKRRDFTLARMLPRDLLHESVREPVWRAFLPGEYDVAVFLAMKQVEIAIRAVAGLPDNEVGVKLARRAFDKNGGVLTDATAEEGERDARGHLFAGALGSYKNPQSHRHVGLTDPVEAVEQVMLASHLLRIVETAAQARLDRRNVPVGA